jgi:hypothetical protein
MDQVHSSIASLLGEPCQPCPPCPLPPPPACSPILPSPSAAAAPPPACAIVGLLRAAMDGSQLEVAQKVGGRCRLHVCPGQQQQRLRPTTHPPAAAQGINRQQGSTSNRTHYLGASGVVLRQLWLL